MSATSRSKEVFHDYESFVEKFKPKLTTDDCYTPKLVYAAVLEWAVTEYGIDPERVIRPFFPGGDYEHHTYPKGCVVLDNPPFSILSKIVRFYQERGISFFLFAPGLTTIMRVDGVCAVCVGAPVEYANGAQVNTSFLTNMELGIKARTAPVLRKMVERAVELERRKSKTVVPKYEYPFDVVTAAALNHLSKYGQELRIRDEDCMRISGLDSQKPYGKAIFGGGLLLSKRAAAERAAAERAAAERAAAHSWSLSLREIELQQGLG